jgi:hypothetical protein
MATEDLGDDHIAEGGYMAGALSMDSILTLLGSHQPDSKFCLLFTVMGEADPICYAA